MSQKTNRQTFIAMVFILLLILIGVAIFIATRDIQPKQHIKTITIEHNTLNPM